ncbi:hypothetical protein GCM10008959_15500 [Deinococcus seoulensis]|uniref:Uncharacterized protein n=1 Tax=Deinococcus seoulensis TaxID=1837379 RepID=A0ABQ2RT19_9DEIO|nr:hypothetical protein GCM10008959_15500 [Deinococcus seoulensis]
MSRGAGTLITLGGLHLGSFRKVKSLLLLVFVGLEGPTPRRQLAGLLWPRAAKPEVSLRVALHALREHDGGALGGEERLVAGVACDAVALLSLRGEAAWEAYAGPFLHGVNLPDVSGEFEEWVLGQRERLAGQGVQVVGVHVLDHGHAVLAGQGAQGHAAHPVLAAGGLKAGQVHAVRPVGQRDAQGAGREGPRERRVLAGVPAVRGGPLHGRDGKMLEQVVVEVHQGQLRQGAGGGNGAAADGHSLPDGALTGRYVGAAVRARGAAHAADWAHEFVTVPHRFWRGRAPAGGRAAAGAGGRAHPARGTGGRGAQRR